MPRTPEEFNDVSCRDQALLQLTDRHLVLDQTEAECLDVPNPIRSVSSKVIVSQINYIAKSFRFEYNELKRINNIEGVQYTIESDDENLTILKKIDQHLERQSLHIDPEIVQFATQTHDYEILPIETKMKLCLARIEVLHLQLEMERYDLNVAASKQSNKITEIVCCICLEEAHPSHLRMLTYICGHIYCESCLVKHTSNVCAVCTVRKNRNEVTDQKFRFNTNYHPICRFCLAPFTEESDISYLKCGHVYCDDCIPKLDGVCFCGKFLTTFNQVNDLYPSFI